MLIIWSPNFGPLKHSGCERSEASLGASEEDESQEAVKKFGKLLQYAVNYPLDNIYWIISSKYLLSTYWVVGTCKQAIVCPPDNDDQNVNFIQSGQVRPGEPNDDRSRIQWWNPVGGKSSNSSRHDSRQGHHSNWTLSPWCWAVLHAVEWQAMPLRSSRCYLSG